MTNTDGGCAVPERRVMAHYGGRPLLMLTQQARPIRLRVSHWLYGWAKSDPESRVRRGPVAVDACRSAACPTILLWRLPMYRVGGSRGQGCLVQVYSESAMQLMSASRARKVAPFM